jgi:hypothetical protein
MTNIRKWAGPRFVEKPAPLTAEEVKIKKENFETTVKGVFWLSLAAVAGLLLLVISNFSPVMFLAVAFVVAIAIVSELG